MPKYQNAVGYLLELRNNFNQQWFSAVVDLAVSLNGERPSSVQLNQVWSYLLGDDNYQPQAAYTPPHPAQQTSSLQTVFLEEITDFNNFKKLSSNLKLTFSKKVTLIFGKNGAGKSSICQAFKVLANSEQPSGPLYNARVSQTGNSSPSFAYKFRNWQSHSIWSENSSGYGVMADFIKYFDSTIAISNANGEMKAENAVEVSVFRLEVFEFVRSLTTIFQQHANEILNNKKRRILTMMEEIKSRLAKDVNTESEPFSSWTPEAPEAFNSWVARIQTFTNEQEAELQKTLNDIKQHQAATSAQGLIGLQAQHSMLLEVEKKLTNLYEIISHYSLSDAQKAEFELTQKTQELLRISTTAIHTDVDHKLQDALIRSASKIVDFINIKNCPLCYQALNSNSVMQFQAYHHYLHSPLRQQTDELNKWLANTKSAQRTIKEFSLGNVDILTNCLPNGFFKGLESVLSEVKDSLPHSENSPQSEGKLDKFRRFEEIKGYITSLRQESQNLSNIINQAQNKGQALKESEKALQLKASELVAHRAVSNELRNLLQISSESEIYAKEHRTFRAIDFRTLFRRLSLAGKEAHAELVLDTFENKLNNEYIAMSGMSIDELGVTLSSRAAEQDVIITPNVGRNPVHRVLSEGELKIHSLAVFIAEATVNPSQVIVFDDPVTSFDYDYISNFCERIRNLVSEQENTQIVVLTHNWDFFVNLQTILNRSNLNNSLSVQIIENCSTVKEYIEKWDELCRDIDSILERENEPSSAEKELLSALLRRLIERLTNQFVFNEQRHQYKIKTLRDTDFDKFTKIIPLLPQEASALRDLYSNLSPNIHDDIRTSYTTKPKQQFQRWYSEIIDIRHSVEARRPN